MATANPRSMYPWDTWFSRPKTKLVRGTHFHCQVHSMVAQIRKVAAKRERAKERQVSLQVLEDTILMTVGA